MPKWVTNVGGNPSGNINIRVNIIIYIYIYILCLK